MISLPSITEQRHSPNEWDEYMKGNISLLDIADQQKELLSYQQQLQQEQAIITEWLQQTQEMLNQRLFQTPAA